MISTAALLTALSARFAHWAQLANAQRSGSDQEALSLKEAQAEEPENDASLCTLLAECVAKKAEPAPFELAADIASAEASRTQAPRAAEPARAPALVASALVDDIAGVSRSWRSGEAAPSEAAAPMKLECTRAPALWATDPTGCGILLPHDPMVILARHEERLMALRLAFGSQALFESHVLPFLFQWAAMVQGLPAAAQGLWRNEDGMLAAGLSSATEALRALDARVLGAQMAPMDRDAWLSRVRVALVIGAAIREGSSLARMRLLAKRDGKRPLVRWEPSVESAYAFGLSQRGARFMLSFIAEADAPTLTTLPLALLAVTLPPATRRWLSASIAEAPALLGILEQVLLFHAAESGAARTFSELLAAGSARAVDRETLVRARIEGATPVLTGYIKTLESRLYDRVLLGEMSAKGDRSLLIAARDGFFLRWPEALEALLAESAESALDKEAISEGALVAEALASAGVLARDALGVVVRTVEGAHPLSGVRVVRLARKALIEALLAAAQARTERACRPALHEELAQGGSLALMPALFERVALVASEKDLGPAPTNDAQPSESEPARARATVDDAKPLCEALGARESESGRRAWVMVGESPSDEVASLITLINNTADPFFFTLGPAELFIPEALLAGVDDEVIERLSEAGVLQMRDLPATFGLRTARRVPYWRVKAEARSAAAAGLALDGEGAAHVGLSLTLEGIRLKLPTLRAVRVLSEGRLVALPWPAAPLALLDEAQPERAATGTEPLSS